MYQTYEKVVQKALRFIELHLMETIQVRDLAHEVGYSAFHFQRVFRKVTGKSVSAYIRERRITESARTLITTDERLIDIALACNFQSQEAFTRAFKKTYHMPPNQYRKLLKQITYKGVEDMNIKKGAPLGWTMTGEFPTDYTTGLDKMIVHSGHHSAYLKSIDERAKGFSTLMQQIKAENYLGERIRFSGFAKTEDLKETAGFWMRVDHSSGEVLAFDNMMNRPIKGTTEWSHYSVVLDVPLKSDAIAFGVLLNGSGQIWVDELSFEIVDASIPVTEENPLLDLADEPVNLNFEIKTS